MRLGRGSSDNDQQRDRPSRSGRTLPTEKGHSENFARQKTWRRPSEVVTRTNPGSLKARMLGNAESPQECANSERGRDEKRISYVQYNARQGIILNEIPKRNTNHSHRKLPDRQLLRLSAGALWEVLRTRTSHFRTQKKNGFVSRSGGCPQSERAIPAISGPTLLECLNRRTARDTRVCACGEDLIGSWQLNDRPAWRTGRARLDGDLPLATTRTEKDSMGAIEVPLGAYYGAQTQRARRNFQISPLRFLRSFLCSLGIIKEVRPMQVNMDLGLLPVELGRSGRPVLCRPSPTACSMISSSSTSSRPAAATPSTNMGTPT